MVPAGYQGFDSAGPRRDHAPGGANVGWYGGAVGTERLATVMTNIVDKIHVTPIGPCFPAGRSTRPRPPPIGACPSRICLDEGCSSPPWGNDSGSVQFDVSCQVA